MGDRDDRAGIIGKEALEPGHALGVEVVGRLVEQQHVGLDSSSAHRRHAATLTAGQRVDAMRPRSATAAHRRRLPASGRGPSRLRLRWPRCSSPCRSSSLFISSSIHRLGELRRHRIELAEQVADVGDAELDVAAHVQRSRRAAGSCGRKPTLMSFLRPRFAFDLGIQPAMIRSSDDLPEPFKPSTPILAPGKNDNEMSSRILRFGGTVLDTPCMV